MDSKPPEKDAEITRIKQITVTGNWLLKIEAWFSPAFVPKCLLTALVKERGEYC